MEYGLTSWTTTTPFFATLTTFMMKRSSSLKLCKNWTLCGLAYSIALSGSDTTSIPSMALALKSPVNNPLLIQTPLFSNPQSLTNINNSSSKLPSKCFSKLSWNLFSSAKARHTRHNSQYKNLILSLTISTVFPGSRWNVGMIKNKIKIISLMFIFAGICNWILLIVLLNLNLLNLLVEQQYLSTFYHYKIDKLNNLLFDLLFLIFLLFLFILSSIFYYHFYTLFITSNNTLTHNQCNTNTIPLTKITLLSYLYKYYVKKFILKLISKYNFKFISKLKIY